MSLQLRLQSVVVLAWWIAVESLDGFILVVLVLSASLAAAMVVAYRNFGSNTSLVGILRTEAMVAMGADCGRNKNEQGI